jgi:thiosulfate/3-mercaptopyruvate sulfurtransferase
MPPSAAALTQVNDLREALRSRPVGLSKPVLLDVRWRLAGGGRGDYIAGHLPGAVFIDLDTELAGTPGPAGRHPLPDPWDLQATLRRAGVHRDTSQIVVYDGGGPSGTAAAARAWWVLRWAGVDRVTVLDGGLEAWRAAGGLLTVSVPEPPSGDVQVRPGAMPTLDADLAAQLARTGVLVDARAAERYRGEVEPIDPIAGHIPGAVNAGSTDLIGPDARLLPAPALAARLTALGFRGGERAGAYCGSGVTAAITVLAAVVAGLPAPALYVGSWSEWVSDRRRPVAVGPEPG